MSRVVTAGILIVEHLSNLDRLEKRPMRKRRKKPPKKR